MAVFIPFASQISNHVICGIGSNVNLEMECIFSRHPHLLQEMSKLYDGVQISRVQRRASQLR